MKDSASLWMLATNAILGVVLSAWMMLTLMPFILGYEPLLPGMEAAFILATAWAGWNIRTIRIRKWP